MASPYTKKLALEITIRLQVSDVYSISILDNRWSIGIEFWMAKFIRDFGVSLENEANYKLEYMIMEKLTLKYLYYYSLKHTYNALVLNMLAKWTPPANLLVMASFTNNIEIVKLLLTNRIDIDNEKELIKNAAQCGNLEKVRFLISNRTNISAQIGDSIKYAAQKGNLEVIQLLLPNGGKLYDRNDEAIIIADKNGHNAVSNFIIRGEAYNISGLLQLGTYSFLYRIWYYLYRKNKDTILAPILES